MLDFTTEGVNGGLVTARDPFLLSEGQVSLAAETVLYPNDPTLHSAPGRTTYGSVNGTGLGLAYCAFNGAQDVLLALSAPSATQAVLSVTDYSSTVPGGWAQFLGSLSASSLDVVSVGHEHYVYTGSAPLHLYRDTAGALQLTNMGLLPNTKGPTVALTTGTWSTEASMGEGWYWFLLTERIDDRDLESTSLARPVPCQMTNAASYSFLVTFPTQRNGAATHWCLYISDRQDNGTDPPPLSSFYRCTDPIAIGQTTYTLGGTQVTTTAQYATTVDIAYNGATNTWNSTQSYITGAPDGSYAEPAFDGSSAAASLTFDFSSLSAGLSLVGVQVEVTAKPNTSDGPYTNAAPPRLQAGIARTTGTSTGDWASTLRYVKGGVSTEGKYTLGGTSDNWTDGVLTSGVTCDDFRNGTARLVLTPYPSYEYDYWDQQTAYGSWVAIDAVSVTLTYGGTYVPTFGPAFPFVQQTEAGLDLEWPAYMPPPRANTADMFQNSLVQNDATDPTAICWSLPGQYEYFPSPYRLSFQSKVRDEVTCIRRVGGTLLVGLRNQIKQLTSLTGDFDDLAVDHGIVGPTAATLVDIPGRGPVMAYVAYNGLHATDGISTWTLNEDLDWANTVDVDYLHQCRLVCYPTRYWLVLYYTPPGSTINYKALVFTYHPTHAGDGKMPCTGIISVEGGGACLAFRNGVPTLHTVDGSGNVWTEDDGVANTIGTPTVRTRLWYPNGIGQEGVLERMFVALGDGNGDVSITVQGVVTTRTQPAITLGSSTIDTRASTSDGVNGGVRRLDFVRGECEGMFTTIAATSGALHLRALTYGVQGFGMQDARS